MSEVGRPRKAEGERRSKQAKIRLTIAEHNHAVEQAEAAGMTLAEYVRRRLMGEPVRAKAATADERLLFELNAIGVNLNQIARNLNAERQSRYAPGLPALQARLDRVLREVAETIS